ncbi:helix-turn-helix transcriptional regulator [Lactobacillus sp. DCY120]|uniref:Helix-turn-helix transcriptional regulator n=1 Tax=Bombilactobacillus apium TaxID=2675299 RepID=A0A850R9D3_9LACO|nr:helix-turn-helix transcriptional regulator [Bombilactobacillus apium]NVY97135.1 helix-turn-helix transcriptional regulator [Bombilactobacillus apium]
MELAQNLKKYRKLAQLSQQEVADSLQISRQSISKWENGTHLPDLHNIQRLGKLYQVSLDELINGKVQNGPLASNDESALLFIITRI